ncbi:NYN domain-containing protein [Protaetiibacter mangrovi]|uniref:NYN domain-containing protein n=1 Tax=Protaetiibacter mangrovi TaxID=2970926 RepID=A0ABT1ZII3_9MICO|nr:NYN domain-containing protein [Protaetiibacter mangrovi]MCS0500534.1 NYN domain-containing protein [Protaetiibacter mangrovi]TPX02826.1 NYN domain-containing protein [Schumannella luteola]
MPELTDTDRVAVYIDFDNIVISRYDQLNGDGGWRKDNARDARSAVQGKLQAARVDVSAILDYASSFGTVAVTRAYADWSVPANAAYKGQLVDRAIDLTQLFPASGTKNGADIRLSVDVLEDLFRLPDITHVVIVAGDSDYIALAQRCKRLGRVVVGIGVAGGTSKALISACDEFENYDELPGVEAAPTRPSGRKQASAPEPDAAPAAEPAPATASAPKKAPAAKKTAAPTIAPLATDPFISPTDGADGTVSDREATRLLVRALEFAHTKNEDAEWLNASGVKSQIKRLNPSFNEKSLGFSSFTDFVKSRGNLAEVQVDGQQRRIRLRSHAVKSGE